MKYLFDTNILSELKKAKPEKKVIEFVKSIDNSDIFISCITIGEIKRGIEICKDKDKAKDLNKWLENYLISEFEERIIDVDKNIMLRWSKIHSKIKDLPIFDSLIAATCLERELCLVTRNIKDFVKIADLKIINPWDC